MQIVSKSTIRKGRNIFSRKSPKIVIITLTPDYKIFYSLATLKWIFRTFPTQELYRQVKSSMVLLLKAMI
jgi:hypothetical protein